MLYLIVTVANPGLLEDLITRTAFDWDLMHMCAMFLQEPCSLERCRVAEVTLELLAMRLHVLLQRCLRLEIIFALPACEGLAGLSVLFTFRATRELLLAPFTCSCDSGHDGCFNRLTNFA